MQAVCDGYNIRGGPRNKGGSELLPSRNRKGGRSQRDGTWYLYRINSSGKTDWSVGGVRFLEKAPRR